MPTELNFNKDEEDDQNTQLAGPSSSSEASVDSGPSAASPAPSQRPATPSGRPNIKQYLQANEGAGQKLATGIQGKTEKQASQIGQGISQGQQELEASSQPLAQQLGDEGSNKIKTAFKDPQALLQQQDQLAQFQKLKSGGYQNDIGGIQQAAQQRQQQLGSQVGQLTQAANLAGNESGRFELLRDTYGQPNYSRGQQKLDQLFLQAQPGSAKNLQQGLRGLEQQQSQNLSGLDAATQAKLNALNSLSADRSKEWQNLLSGGAEAGLEQDISQRGLGDINTSAQEQLKQAQTRAANAQGIQARAATPSQLTQDDLDALGLTDLVGSGTYGVNINDYIKNVNQTPTLAGATSPEEFARYRALQQLSGDTSGEDIFGGAEAAGNWKPYELSDNINKSITDSKNQWENIKRQQEINNILNIRTNQFGGLIDPNNPNTFMGADTFANLKKQLGQATSADQVQQLLTNAAMQDSPTSGFTPEQAYNYYWGNSPFQKYWNDLQRARGTKIGATKTNNNPPTGGAGKK